MPPTPRLKSGAAFDLTVGTAIGTAAHRPLTHCGALCIPHTISFFRQEIKKARSIKNELLEKITRRYLLSRFHNYHRLQALSIRIRDGNARFHLDMVAGRTPNVVSNVRRLYARAVYFHTRIIDRRDQYSSVSIGSLNPLLSAHVRPINQVVSLGTSV